MAVRLRSEFTAYGHKPPVNKYFVLEIHDTTLGIDADIDFSMRSSPIHGYDPESNDIFHPVRASTLSFNIIIEKDNTDLESFLSDYVAAPEGQFLVKLKRFVSVGVYETIFIGKLLHDITTLVKTKNPTLSLSAVDPFLELEKFEYSLPTYPYTWIQIILYYILMKSETLQYFYPNDSDEILHIYNKWKDVLHVDTTDILSLTFMQNYFTRENDGQIERKKVVYVLAELLRALASRIYFEDGVFVIEQIKARADTSVTYSRYSVDKTFLGTFTHDQVTFDFDNSIAYQIDVEPEITFLPPINSVILAQNGDYIDNLLFGYQFNHYTTPSGPHLISEVTELIDQKVYCRLVINPYVDTQEAYTIGHYKYLYMVFDVQIRVGSKYLVGKAGIAAYPFQSGLNITDAGWASSNLAVVRIYMPAHIVYSDLQNNAKDTFYTFDIITPILEEVGEVYFDFNYVGTYSDIALSGAIDPLKIPSPYSLRWAVNSNTVAILKDIEESNNTGTTITTLVNNTANTKMYNVAYDMGSFPDGSSYQRLKVNDIDTDSEEWVHPDFGNMPFQYMAMEDIRSIYASASQVFVTTMRLNKVYPGVLKMRHRMLYDGDYFIPLYIEANLVEETAVCLWFSIDADLVAVDPPVVSTPVVPILKHGLTGPTTTVNNMQGEDTGSSSSSNAYFDTFIISGDTIDLSDYSGFPDPDIVTSNSINLSIDFYIGSTHFIFNNVAQGSLTQNEFALDFSTLEILLNRDHTGKKASIKIIDRYVVDTDSQVN